MEIGKWTEYVIGMEDPVILQNTGVPPGGGALGDDGCGYLFCVLKREREEGGTPGGWTGCARRSKTQKGSLQRLAPGGETRSARWTRDSELLLEAIAPGGGT
ncbi:hypothetical protein DEO72_LG10g2088 [Vigna unguiculata]|uniref:Uncharacterized protein n=1 Tax=Vigna unguiculata TaxID=3917 RepID=A0A4D6NAU3_VIGUN|nr:hypothetical protein DEO72_LG10g2088 [Vigna unguiculata]